MLDIAQIRTIAEEVIRDALGTDLVEDVYAEPGLDWTGDEALDILVVLRKDAVRALQPGKELSAANLDLSDRMVEHGEMRFPFISYTYRAGYRRRLRAKAKLRSFVPPRRSPSRGNRPSARD
jgi:hypothetical protein